MTRASRTALLPLATSALLAATHAAPSLTGIAPLRRAVWPGLSGKGWPDHVALTFDDGPDPESTPQFLDLLTRRGVRATFFLLGQMLVGAPDLARRMVAEGHEVAIHGWTHRNHLRVPPRQVHDELARTSELIEQVTGTRPIYHRPPYGVMTAGDLAAGRALGLTPVLWTTWGRDWEARATPERVLRTLRPQLRGGGTILLHDSDCTSAPGSWRNTLGAMDGLIDLVEDSGHTLGPLREHGLAAPVKWAAAAAALASALAYSIASVTQHREAGSLDTHEVGSPSLLLRLALRPWWLLGALADVFGVALQTLALGWGAVVLVQPLLVTGVAMAVVLAAAVAREWPHPRELALAIGCSVALGVLVVTLDTHGGRQRLGFWHFLPYGSVVVVLTLLAVLLARRLPGSSAGWLGAAAGLMVGASSVLLKVCAGQLGDGVLRLLTHWHVYGFVAFGGVALVLSQNAFQAGRMAPGIASLSVVEPIVAIAIAVPLLHEHLTVTPVRLVLDLAAGLAAAYCVIGLADATERRVHVSATAGAGSSGG